MADRKINAEIARLRAGSDPTPATPGVKLTPGQWWHKLLELDEDDRLDRLAIFMRALDGVQAVRRLADSEDLGLRTYAITADDIRGAVLGREVAQ